MIFPNRGNIQRIVHYQGRRPWRALFFVFIGYLLGWYACTHPGIPAHSATNTLTYNELMIGCGDTPWQCNENL